MEGLKFINLSKCYNKTNELGEYMSTYTIQNSFVSVTIDEHAAEIHSFFDRETKIEAIWQGDKTYWAGRNPILFPIVGKTWDGILHIQGKEYRTGNHGFARNSEFKCIKHTDTQIVMELCDSEETLAQYPFRFRLEVTYTLEAKKLDIAYRIENRDGCTMPFNFGLHPAFNCPLEEGKAFDAYHLELNQKEVVDDQEVDVIALDKDALKKTIIIQNPRSTCTKLTDGTHGVQVEYQGYPWLAYWSPYAPFVCIEPWYSHTDFEKNEVPFEKREGTILLDVNDSWQTAYSITLF